MHRQMEIVSIVESTQSLYKLLYDDDEELDDDKLKV